MALTRQRLKEVLLYDPVTGAFTWRIAVSNKCKAGMRAGSINKSTGYREIGLDGKVWLAHRLAFLYMLGRWPKGETDHKNRKRHDCRWRNLRDATRSQNLRNSGVRKRNATRQKHITRNKRRGGFQVVLRGTGGKYHNLGRFNEMRNAILVRDTWLPILCPNF